MTTTSEKLKKFSQEIQDRAKPRIDAKAESIEPIDFSFKDLMSLEGFGLSSFIRRFFFCLN